MPLRSSSCASRVLQVALFSYERVVHKVFQYSRVVLGVLKLVPVLTKLLQVSLNGWIEAGLQVPHGTTELDGRYLHAEMAICSAFASASKWCRFPVMPCAATPAPWTGAESRCPKNLAYDPHDLELIIFYGLSSSCLVACSRSETYEWRLQEIYSDDS